MYQVKKREKITGNAKLLYNYMNTVGVLFNS